MYTTTVETYNPSLQTLDNDESELSEEDYNTPTDVDTSEKEIVSTKLGKQDQEREREREELGEGEGQILQFRDNGKRQQSREKIKWHF